jgi:hypothetical protein
MPTWRGTTNSNWGTASNWTSPAAVPTAATDAIFDNLSPDCTVNVAAVCANLNFNSGTGYANTITMTNAITVGLSVPIITTNTAVTLSSGMTIAGAGGINTRYLNTGTLTLTSNGKTWPNAFSIFNVFTSGAAGVVALVDNWVVNGTLTIGSGTFQTTFNGAFSITANSNFVIGSTSVGPVRSTSGAISTIILGGTGTWSQASTVSSFGINLNINTAGTITISTGCSYGGLGTNTGSSFTYTAGTVICQGTFTFVHAQSSIAYTINLNGSSSTSATATSSTGVNFNNLNFTSNSGVSQQINITGNVCVVGNISIASTVITKANSILSGGNVYLNGGASLTGYFGTGTIPTTYTFQGTGTWTESITLTAASNNFGISGNVIINTSGTITLGSHVGFRVCTATYTNGTVIYAGFGFRVNTCTLAGFSAVGTLPLLQHTTTSANAAGAFLTINDSTELQITSLIFQGFNTNLSFIHAGTKGWTASTFYFQQTAAVAGFDSGLGLTAGNTYTVTSSFIFNARSRFQVGGNSGMARVGVGTVYFTLAFGAYQNVYVMGATNINSSLGQTIWSRRGLITTTQNWNNWVIPATRFSSFISG